jgi:hypothetical protein
VRKYITLLIFIGSNCLILKSQIICTEGGPNYGSLFSLRKSDPHINEEFGSFHGLCFGISFSQPRKDSTKNFFKYGLGYEKYGGYFYHSEGGLGGSIQTEGNFLKHVIDLEFYPLNKYLIPNLLFSLGIESNFRLNYSINGTQTSWQYTQQPSSTSENLSDVGVKPNFFNLGLNCSLAYEINIRKFIIRPSYKYFVGINGELYGHSQRHTLQLGFGYRINKRRFTTYYSN